MDVIGAPDTDSTITCIRKETGYFNKDSAVDKIIGSPQIPRRLR